MERAERSGELHKRSTEACDTLVGARGGISSEPWSEGNGCGRQGTVRVFRRVYNPYLRRTATALVRHERVDKLTPPVYLESSLIYGWGSIAMPTQEVYLEQNSGLDQLQVLKTYDIAFAKEAFLGMDSSALNHLRTSLSVDEAYDVDDIPNDESALADFLWEEMVDSAREDGQIRSFFVVRRTSSLNTSLLYVSGDWPSAESFTQQLLTG